MSGGGGGGGGRGQTCLLCLCTLPLYVLCTVMVLGGAISPIAPPPPPTPNYVCPGIAKYTLTGQTDRQTNNIAIVERRKAPGISATNAGKFCFSGQCGLIN